MKDLLIGLAFLIIVLLPAFLAIRNISKNNTLE
jgi:hypothetical protein